MNRDFALSQRRHSDLERGLSSRNFYERLFVPGNLAYQLHLKVCRGTCVGDRQVAAAEISGNLQICSSQGREGDWQSRPSDRPTKQKEKKKRLSLPAHIAQGPTGRLSQPRACSIPVEANRSQILSDCSPISVTCIYPPPSVAVSTNCHGCTTLHSQCP